MCYQVTKLSKCYLQRLKRRQNATIIAVKVAGNIRASVIFHTPCIQVSLPETFLVSVQRTGFSYEEPTLSAGSKTTMKSAVTSGQNRGGL